MEKKLFIIGAGASKDINREMPLGADIIREIKFLKFRIYYELVALVTASCFYKKSFAENTIDSIATPSFVISKLIEETSRIEINSIGEKNVKIIEELILKILKSDDRFRYEKCENSDQKNQEITKEVLNFFGLDQYNPTDQFTNSIFYQLTSFQPNIFFDRPVRKNEELLNFKSCLEEILNFIFPEDVKNGVIKEYNDWLEVRKWFREELKNYVINGIIISILLDPFDENLYSIDHLINFLSSATRYNDNFSETYQLPKVKDLENFTTEFIASYVGKKCMSLEDEKNWINCLRKMVFLNKESEIIQLANNIELINFNYDFYLEEIFDYDSSNSNSESRKKALDILIKKSRESHIYGAMKSAGGDSFVNYLLREIKWFSHYLTTKGKVFNFQSGEFKSETVATTSISKLDKIKDEIDKIKESKQINLIRTDFTTDNIKSYFSKIENSNIIYILGFGFDNWNLRNIGLLDGVFSLSKEANLISGKTIYITNCGDLAKIRIMIEKLFRVRLYKESESIEFIESKKKSEKREIKYSFWRSEPNGQNDVFVSTKPVYRALTEDFIF